jgi:hypothetical protein
MRVKNLFAVSLLSTLPTLAGASVIYRFSEPVGDASVGFTYTSSDYLTAASTLIPAGQFTRCDNSGMPAWNCTSARLNQMENNGPRSVEVYLTMTYAANPADAFSTDQLFDSFGGATLTATGTYRGHLNNAATFTVQEARPSETAANPEPSTWALLLGGLGFVGWQFRRRRRSIGKQQQ